MCYTNCGDNMNNKGFTLVELLATMVVLSIIMIMAVPNVVGVVQRNKNKTYVEDSKKLVSLAEYKLRSNSNYKPTASQTFCFYLSFLGTDELSTAPDGGTYSSDYSFVKVQLISGEFKYTVQLVEAKNNQYIGVHGVENSNLYSGSYQELVKTKAYPTTCYGTDFR